MENLMSVATWKPKAEMESWYKIVLKESGGNVTEHSFVSGEKPVTGFCQYGNETSGSLSGTTFLSCWIIQLFRMT
jgi:hypothetical protein